MEAEKTTVCPFKTIAAALSFSPYCFTILSQAKHLSDALGASLVMFHVGEKTPEKEQSLNEMMRELNIDYDSSRMIWMDESNEVQTILELCKLNTVDLLVLGARAQENIVKFYIGSVARKISRKAKCSVMLIANNSQKQAVYDTLVVNGNDNPKTQNTIHAALYFAKNLNSKQVYVVNELDNNLSMMTDANAKTSKQKESLKNVEALMHSLILKHKNSGFDLISKTVKGKAGYAINKFAESKKADLLVINSPDVKLGVMDRIFTHDMEHILANLPCNLLIVYS
jgi:nucleotide-binding universal stress UspA family protein